MEASVLVVGVDPATRAVLEEEGFALCEVLADASVEELCEFVAGNDAVLLGIEPLLSSLTVESMRRAGITEPVVGIFSNMRRQQWGDECVRFLDCGGDNVLLDPEPGETVATLRACIRRFRTKQRDVACFELHDARLVIDFTAKRIWLNEQPLLDRLTGHEAQALFTLASRSGPRTREELRSALYGHGNDRNTNTLEVFVSRIRDKLGSASRLVRTVRGTGYELIGRVS